VSWRQQRYGATAVAASRPAGVTATRERRAAARHSSALWRRRVIFGLNMSGGHLVEEENSADQGGADMNGGIDIAVPKEDMRGPVGDSLVTSGGKRSLAEINNLRFRAVVGICGTARPIPYRSGRHFNRRDEDASNSGGAAGRAAAGAMFPSLSCTALSLFVPTSAGCRGGGERWRLELSR